MAVEATDIAGLLVVRQPVHADHRGFLQQTWVMSELEAALGRRPAFVQANHARSRAGVLRGFHAEPWDELVHVTAGRVLAAVADVRPDSPTFGEVVTVELGDDEDRLGLFVGTGLANSYYVHGPGHADYVYAVTAEWTPDADSGSVRWDDPTLGVAWPTDAPILSDADRDAPTLRDRFPDHPRFA